MKITCDMCGLQQQAAISGSMSVDGGELIVKLPAGWLYDFSGIHRCEQVVCSVRCAEKLAEQAVSEPKE